MLSDIFNLMDHLVDFLLPKKKDLLKLEQTYLPLFLDRKNRNVPRNASVDLNLDILLTILQRNLDPESMLRVLHKLLKAFKGHPKLKKVLKRWMAIVKKQQKLAMKHRFMMPGIKLDDLATEALFKKLKKFLHQEDAKLQKFEKKKLRQDMLKDQRLKMDMMMHFLILDFAIRQQAIRDQQLKMQEAVKKAQEQTLRLQKEELETNELLTNPALKLELPNQLQMILEFQTQLDLERMNLEQAILQEQEMMEQMMLNSMLEQQQMIALWQQHQLLYQAQIAQMQYVERLRYQFEQIRLKHDFNDEHTNMQQAANMGAFNAMAELLRNEPTQGLEILGRLHQRVSGSRANARHGFESLHKDLFDDLDLDLNEGASPNPLNKLSDFIKNFVQLFSLPNTFAPQGPRIF